MQDIEPFYNWEKYYKATEDSKSPFFGKSYNTDYYENDIYGYYINPYWENIGSETLYLKVLYANYHEGYAIIEFLGEWNDALHNDIMFLKRNVIDLMVNNGINKFILIGENLLNWHFGGDDYYSEWFDEVEDGWIVAIGFRNFITSEWERYGLDNFINFGGTLDFEDWRTSNPKKLYLEVKSLIVRRLGV